MVVINPAFGPVTAEEYGRLIEIESRRAATRQLVEQCIVIYEETNQDARIWWNEIRQKYGVTETSVVIDPDSLMIRKPSQGGH